MKERIGFRILDCARPDAQLIRAFKGIPSSNIGDQMERLYNTDSSLKSLNGVSLCGPAFTVKAPQGDNLMFHKALDLAEPGDILVGDQDGLVIIPPEFAVDILPVAIKKFESEQKAITTGQGTSREWVDKALEAL